MEKEAIEQYTLIPNLPYLGFDMIAFTFSCTKELVHPLWEQGKKWAAKQPNVVFVSTGQGMNSDAIMVSVHKNYADFVKFYQIFRRLGQTPQRLQNLSNEYRRKRSIEVFFIQLLNRCI